MEANIKMQTQQDPYRKLIIFLSIIIPVAVVILFSIPPVKGYDFTFLPPIYATINGLTAVLLIAALIAIKKGNRRLHETLVKICIGLSTLFLLMYVVYHLTTAETHFGGEGTIRYVYFFILITHILLSVVIIPLVLFTFSRALSGNFARHRALAKVAFPAWLYVAVTGVVVYLMISPYYQ